jgi:hypothetical protein
MWENETINWLAEVFDPWINLRQKKHGVLKQFDITKSGHPKPPASKGAEPLERNPVLEREQSTRKMFEQYCKEGIRPMMYDLTRLAGGEYASCFTEWAWKIYWKGINDSDGAW